MIAWFNLDVVDGRFIAGIARLADDVLEVRMADGRSTTAELGSLPPTELAKRLLRELDQAAQEEQLRQRIAEARRRAGP